MNTHHSGATRWPNPLAATGYAFGHLFLAVPALVLWVLELVFTPLIIVTVGLFALQLVMPGVQAIAHVLRTMAGSILEEPVVTSYRDTTGKGMIGRLLTWARDPSRWRDFAGLFLAATVGLVLAVLVISLLAGAVFYAIYPFLLWVTPPGIFDQQLGLFTIDTVGESFAMWVPAVVLLLLWWRLAGPLVRLRARIDRAVLGSSRSEVLEQRVQVLTETRAETIDHSAAELRRIERDLHDGPQARLVALGMNLGLVEELLERDPEAAQRLIAEARGTTGSALVELRSMVRGIHPPVLADRGLAGAVQALALDMAIPVRVESTLPGRPPAPVESAAYFAIAECLANIGKHAAAEQAWIELSHEDGMLTAVVGDDGIGGADPHAGTGLLGVMRRLSAFDGRMTVSSPDLGPTLVTLEVPCVLSSPRTTPSSGTA